MKGPQYRGGSVQTPPPGEYMRFLEIQCNCESMKVMQISLCCIQQADSEEKAKKRGIVAMST